MSETPKLSLPLLAASQAQKHLVINEALSRLDALFMLSAKGRTQLAPPPNPAEGDRWIVPAGATGAWSGNDQRIAVYINGWDFIDPLPGWRAWVEDESIEVVFDSGVWTALIYTPPAIGGAVVVLSFTHAPTGSVSDSPGMIPANALVFAVTARVKTALSGVTGWSLGVAGAPTRFGSGHGVAVNSVVRGPTTSPLAHPVATPLRLTAEGGSFSGGTVEFNIHYMTFAPPDPV